MKVLPKFIDNLQGDYLSDHDYAERYPGSWIDNCVRNLSYEELGVLIGELFPLMEGLHFDLGGRADGHGLFEAVVDTIVEQLFVHYGIIAEKANASERHAIHAGRLALVKSADPEVLGATLARSSEVREVSAEFH